MEQKAHLAWCVVSLLQSGKYQLIAKAYTGLAIKDALANNSMSIPSTDRLSSYPWPSRNA